MAVTTDTLAKICRALNCTVDDIGYTPINNFTTVELGCEKGNVISTTIH